MFEMYLKSRPIDFGIDYEKLSKLTESYVAADIELIVNDASRNALKNKERISMDLLLNVIINTKPSVSISELDKYDQLNKKLTGDNSPATNKNNERPSIGFKK